MVLWTKFCGFATHRNADQWQHCVQWPRWHIVPPPPLPILKSKMRRISVMIDTLYTNVHYRDITSLWGAIHDFGEGETCMQDRKDWNAALHSIGRWKHTPAYVRHNLMFISFRIMNSMVERRWGHCLRLHKFLKMWSLPLPLSPTSIVTIGEAGWVADWLQHQVHWGNWGNGRCTITMYMYKISILIEEFFVVALSLVSS
jgi:hypothetical protein